MFTLIMLIVPITQHWLIIQSLLVEISRLPDYTIY